MGQFFRANSGQFLNYGYQLPVDTLASAIKGADSRREQQLKEADALDDALNINALDVDLGRKQELLQPINDRIDELTTQMMEDPTNFSGIDSEMIRLRKNLRNQLQDGELGAIGTRFDEYHSQVKALRDAAKKDPDRFRTTDLDNLIRFKKRNLESIQFDPSIGTFNHVNLGAQAAFADLEKKAETLGKGYKADLEARTGHRVVTLNGSPYIITSSGERKQVKPQDIYKDIYNSLVNDPEVVDYYNQQMEIGAYTQDQVLDALDRVAKRAASKFGFSEDKQKSSVQIERGALADRRSRNRVKENNLVVSRASGKLTQSVGATNMSDAIGRRTEMANQVSLSGRGMQQDNIAMLQNMVKAGTISADAANAVNTQQKRLTDLSDQFANLMHLNQDIPQSLIDEYYAKAGELSETLNAQPNIKLPQGKLIQDQISRVGGQISKYMLNKRSTDIATGMFADTAQQSTAIAKMNTPVSDMSALSSQMVGDANNAVLEDLKIGVKKMGADNFLASYGNDEVMYLDDNGRPQSGPKQLMDGKSPKIVGVTPLANKIEGVNGMAVAVNMSYDEPVTTIVKSTNKDGEESSREVIKKVKRTVTVLTPASSFTDLDGAERLDEINRIVEYKGEINNIQHMYNVARSYDKSGARSDLYDKEYVLSNGMIFKPSATSADRITLRTKDGTVKEIHLNDAQGLKAVLQSIQ